MAIFVVFDDGRGLRALVDGSLPRAKRERVALIALEVPWGVEVVVKSRRDGFVGQEVGDVEADDLSAIVVCCCGFDAFDEARD